MTRAEKLDRLRPYVRELASLMGLAGWRIRVDDETPQEAGSPDGDALAGSWVPYNSDESTIHLSDKLLDPAATTSDELRATLVHELLHCRFERPYTTATRALEEHVSPAVWKAVETARLSQHEIAVDGYAWAWARFLPEPPSLEDRAS